MLLRNCAIKVYFSNWVCLDLTIFKARVAWFSNESMVAGIWPLMCSFWRMWAGSAVPGEKWVVRGYTALKLSRYFTIVIVGRVQRIHRLDRVLQLTWFLLQGRHDSRGRRLSMNLLRKEGWPDSLISQRSGKDEMGRLVETHNGWWWCVQTKESQESSWFYMQFIKF